MSAKHAQPTYSSITFKHIFQDLRVRTNIYKPIIYNFDSIHLISYFTESPDYSDRLVWLSGLSNLQLEHVTSYLAPLITGTLGHSIHERFYAVWATMPLAHRYPTEVYS